VISLSNLKSFINKLIKIFKQWNISTENRIYVLFTVCAVAVVICGIYYYTNIRQPLSPVINAIPPEPALILHCNNTMNLFTSILKEDNICKAIFGFKNSRKIYNIGFFYSSIIADNNIKKIISEKPLLIVGYNDDKKGNNLLFLISLFDNKQEKNIKNFLSILTGSIKHHRNVISDKADIYSLTFQHNKQKLFWTVHKGVFTSSLDSSLVVKSIFQLDNYDSSLINDKTFKKIYNSVGKKVDANLFINSSSFVNVCKNYVNEKYYKYLSAVQNFAGWSALDINVKANSLIFNGFTVAPDSLMFAGLFNNQKTSQIKITSFIPYNTSMMLYFGINNFLSFYPNLKTFHLNNKLIDNNYDLIKQKCDSVGFDIESALVDIMGKEYALVSTATDNKNLYDNIYAVFNVSDSILARQTLQSLSKLFSCKSFKTDTLIQKNFLYGCIDLPSLVPAFFGQTFSSISHNYFVLYKDFIIFGNSVESLKKIMAYVETGKTLQTNPNFTHFSDNITNESNMFLYCNIRKFIGVFKDFFNLKIQNQINENLKSVKNFEAFAIQFYNKDNLLYTNLCLKHNPAYIEENPALWEVMLDTIASSIPYVFKNNIDNSINVLIFDINNVLYSINRTGQIIWKIQLPEKIISHIYSVDINKKGEIFYVFNSEKKLYVIDNKGQLLKGYPLNLPSEASAGMSVFDYYNKKDYRIIIPLKNKKIININFKGENIFGWEIPLLDAVANNNVSHFKIAGDDILAVSTSKGTVYILNKRGGIIFSSAGKMKIADKTVFYADDKNLFFAATDGKIYSIDTYGHVKNISVYKYSPNNFNFLLCDMDNNGKNDFVFIDKGKLNIYDYSYKLIYSYDEKPELKNKIFISGSKKKPVLIIPTVNNYFQFFNYKGIIKIDYPVTGSEVYTTGIFDEDNSINFVTSKGKNIYYYLFKYN